MPRPNRPKKKPPIEISDNKSISTSLFLPLLLLLAYLGQEKKEDILSLLLKKKTKNLQKRQPKLNDYGWYT
jgi:hypothetical protein